MRGAFPGRWDVGQVARGCRHAVEVGPAVALEIVQLAGGARAQVLPRRPDVADRVRGGYLFEELLRIGEVVQRDLRFARVRGWYWKSARELFIQI